MADSPLISVIVVNLNRRDLLSECLESINSQTFRGFEIILVDNGSTDGSCALARAEFPGVKVIELDSNHGFAGGNNIGIRAARGTFVALLNNDAVAHPSWLGELAQEFRDPRVGFVASRVIFFDRHDLLDSAGDGLSIFGSGFRRGHLRDPREYETREFVFGASGSAPCYRRSMLEDIGLFDEDFFAVYEDVDLSLRARLAGYECIYSPGAIVYHHGWSTVGHLSDDYVYWGHRNVEYLYWKNMPGVLLWLCLLPHLLYDFGGLVYFGAKGHIRPFMRAKRDALRNWQITLAKRHSIQARRKLSVLQISRWLDSNFLPLLVREKFSGALSPNRPRP